MAVKLIPGPPSIKHMLDKWITTNRWHWTSLAPKHQEFSKQRLVPNLNKRNNNKIWLEEAKACSVSPLWS